MTDREQIRRDAERWTEPGQDLRVVKMGEVILALLAELDQAERERDEAITGRDDLPMAHVLLAKLDQAGAQLAAVQEREAALVEAVRKFVEAPGGQPGLTASRNLARAFAAWEQAQK